MKITIPTTSAAVPKGPTTGPSHDKAEEPATVSEVTTTGREATPGARPILPMSVLMSSIVSCSFSTDPPFPAPRTSAIFDRMLTR